MIWVRGSALLLLFTLVGCGSKLYPVEGTIVWKDNDKPVTELVGGAVNFEPDDGKGKSATAPIGPEARYQLYTTKPGDGVLPGAYRVTLSPPLSANPDKPTRSVLHKDYERLDTTKLKVTVAEQKNEVPLKLERIKP